MLHIRSSHAWKFYAVADKPLNNGLSFVYKWFIHKRHTKENFACMHILCDSDIKNTKVLKPIPKGFSI